MNCAPNLNTLEFIGEDDLVLPSFPQNGQKSKIKAPFCAQESQTSKKQIVL